MPGDVITATAGAPHPPDGSP